MSLTLRLLLVEDSADDAALLLRELRRGGFAPVLEHVQTREAFCAALDREEWDLIVADYNLPAFDGFTALRLYRERDLETPFFLISGTVGESVAVEAMRAGAHDYLLKENLTRLVPAVLRELREAASRRERRRAEHALRESEERFRLLVENSYDLVAEMEPNGRMLYASPHYGVLAARPVAELTGVDLFSLVHPADRERVSQALLRGGRTTPYRLLCPGTADHWLESASRTYRTSSGAERVVVISRDITEQRQAELAHAQLESQLRQSQKMEAIGTLAGGIAHDFNNILTGILGNVELATLELSGDHLAHPRLQDAQLGCLRARDLVNRILTFSRRSEQPRTVNALPPIIRESLQFLRATLPAKIELRSEFDPACPPVVCDPTQLQQVIMNLGVNAGHAMDDRGGTLTVRLGLGRPDVTLISTAPALGQGLVVVLTVSDTGCGMDAATRDRIFEPFFTTKPVGEGTGLGLAVVHGIMQRHQGAISVESEVGRGTTFTLYFPAAQVSDGRPRDAAPANSSAQHAIRGSGERVFFIDDEPSVMQLAGRMLGMLGYQARTFGDPHAAIEAFEHDPGAVDVVVSDLSMPGLTGVEVIRRLRAVRPELPVILTTGYMRSREAEQVRALGISCVIEKPFTMEMLASSLKRLLGSVAR